MCHACVVTRVLCVTLLYHRPAIYFLRVIVLNTAWLTLLISVVKKYAKFKGFALMYEVIKMLLFLLYVFK